jgi:short chain dehydrogenase
VRRRDGHRLPERCWIADRITSAKRSIGVWIAVTGMSVNCKEHEVFTVSIKPRTKVSILLPSMASVSISRPDGRNPLRCRSSIADRTVPSTSVIGLGIAQILASHGADIVLNGFGNAEGIEAVRADVSRKHGVRVIYDGADMSKPPTVRGLIETMVGKLGSIDCLVNNAGLQFTAPVEAFPAEKWDAILAINLSAAFHAIAAAVPHMRKRGWGRIVNIASTHDLVGLAQ